MTETKPEQCIICGQMSSSTTGLQIQGKHICEDCEREIVFTTVMDRRYEFYKNKLKEIWARP